MTDTVKAKQKRTIKPVYAVMSVSKDGSPIELSKEDVTIHMVVKNADDLLEALDAGSLPAGSFYKRIALDG